MFVIFFLVRIGLFGNNIAASVKLSARDFPHTFGRERMQNPSGTHWHCLQQAGRASSALSHAGDPADALSSLSRLRHVHPWGEQSRDPWASPLDIHLPGIPGPQHCVSPPCLCRDPKGLEGQAGSFQQPQVRGSASGAAGGQHAPVGDRGQGASILSQREPFSDPSIFIPVIRPSDLQR